MPKISVIMPVYNTDKQYLMEAIDSILQQTYADFELLIIDDASTTDIKGIISQYADQRLKYFRLPENHGAAYARNIGIQKAEGEFIAFMDSDDVSLPGRLEAQIRFFIENPAIDCIGTAMLIIPEGKEWHFPANHPDILFQLLSTNTAFGQPSVMLHKKILLENNIFYNSEYIPAEDYALWLDLIGLCKFANINEILVKYRWHGNNLSITQADKQKVLSNKAKINKLLVLAECSDEKAYDALINFLETPHLFVMSEIPLIEAIIPKIIRKMATMGISEPKAKNFMRKNLTKLIRKVPSKEIVRKLCFSPLNSYLNAGIHRQLLYYFTKGFF